MKTLKPGTCALCKHWDSRERREVAKWAKTADPDHGYFQDAECEQITENINPVVGGDGWLDRTDTDWDFGCALFEVAEGEE